MNFRWECFLEEGQKPIGFVDGYSSSVNYGVEVLALINYLPQFLDSDFERNVHITLFLKGSKEQITDGLFHWIYDDLCEIVREKENVKFPEASKKQLRYALTQTFLVEEMPDLKYLSHGDYHISRK